MRLVRSRTPPATPAGATYTTSNTFKIRESWKRFTTTVLSDLCFHPNKQASKKSESPWSGDSTELLNEVASSDLETVACLFGTLPGLWELLLRLY